MSFSCLRTAVDELTAAGCENAYEVLLLLLADDLLNMGENGITVGGCQSLASSVFRFVVPVERRD